jgi:2-polyprenyl-3-methyl-5-hydroxy-6-metoxy-1,4-benzoquinol methylase/glycosyltransferase involved in cell wall biosynthesis
MENSQDNRAGIGIGVITRGNVSIKWMMHMKQVEKHIPIGMFWKYIVVEGKSWADGRTEVVRRAQAENFRYLMFIDDDTFIPEDAVIKLLQSNKPLISGIYWTKSENSSPVIFEKFGSGPMFKFPIDEVFRIAGSGAGCLLIDMNIFDEFDKQNIPYFKENWVMELDDGKKMICPIGEDHYLFYMANKLGFEAYAHGGVLCDHYDVNTKKFYPTPDIVREITGEKLKTLGREDIVSQHNKLLQIDNSRKTIVFVDGNSFDGDELEKRGVGGAETCIINITKRLSKYFNVHVFNACFEPGIYDGVAYHNLNTNLNDLKSLSPDWCIVNRNTDIIRQIKFKENYGVKKLGLWAHDISSSPAYQYLEQVYNDLDLIILLSDWHVNDFKTTFKFISDNKIKVLRNGVDLDRFKSDIGKVSGKLIYSSTPFRGLDILTDIFPMIKKEVPNAELHVFSSMKLYGSNYDDNQFLSLYNKLKSIPGIVYHGSVKQDVLAKEMQSAELLVYPNTYPETSCITVMEAVSAKTPVVTSNKAALPETLPSDCGFLIDGNQYTTEYKSKFAETVVDILKNRDKLQGLIKTCSKYDMSWENRINDWKVALFGIESIDVDNNQKIGNINTEEYWNEVYKQELENNKIRNNQVTSFLIIEQIKKLGKQDAKLLDIGCGTGEFTRMVKLKNPEFEVWGSDFSSVAIDYCRQQNKTIFYANHPIFNDKFEKGYFDVVSAMHVIEHLEEPEKLVEKAKYLLNDNGLFVLVVPINDKPWKEHLKIWTVKDIELLLTKFNCNYELLTRKLEHLKYSDGTCFEEAIVYVRFKNG